MSSERSPTPERPRRHHALSSPQVPQATLISMPEGQGRMRFRHQTFDAPELKKWVVEDDSQTESTAAEH
jgi:hypothetical protein